LQLLECESRIPSGEEGQLARALARPADAVDRGTADHAIRLAHKHWRFLQVADIELGGADLRGCALAFADDADELPFIRRNVEARGPPSPLQVAVHAQLGSAMLHKRSMAIIPPEERAPSIVGHPPLDPGALRVELAD